MVFGGGLAKNFSRKQEIALKCGNNKKIKSPVMELGGSNEAVEREPPKGTTHLATFILERRQLKIPAVPTPVITLGIFDVDSILGDL